MQSPHNRASGNTMPQNPTSKHEYSASRTHRCDIPRPKTRQAIQMPIDNNNKRARRRRGANRQQTCSIIGVTAAKAGPRLKEMHRPSIVRPTSETLSHKQSMHRHTRKNELENCATHGPRSRYRTCRIAMRFNGNSFTQQAMIYHHPQHHDFASRSYSDQLFISRL